MDCVYANEVGKKEQANFFFLFSLFFPPSICHYSVLFLLQTRTELAPFSNATVPAASNAHFQGK